MRSAQSLPHERELVPRALVIAMFGLMVATMGLVTFAQVTDHPQIGVVVEAPVVTERQVVLRGDRSGVYTVHDLAGRQIAVSNADRAGFIGVIGRVFDRERMMKGAAPDAPITVLRRDNGHVAIRDDATGLSVELIGYGADNVAAFARLLD